MRVGLVLGAGGLVGQAYQAGVLAALEHDLGWDPRRADVIVGTSAGSVTGLLLRLGVPAHDLAAWAVDAPLSTESAAYEPLLNGGRPDFPPVTMRFGVRELRLPSRDLLRRIVRQPWALRPAVLAMSVLPPGEIDLLDHAEALGEVPDDDWPEGLWVCAARHDDGRLVVFGREGAPAATVPEAVAASCAIPAYFRPLSIRGVEYVDGGVASLTNADVVRAADLDLVIVVAPLSVAGGVAKTRHALVRYAAHRRLEREIRSLRATGATVVRIEPSEPVLEAMGPDLMDGERAEQVVQEAFIDTGRYAATPRIAVRLDPLAAGRSAGARAVGGASAD